MEASVNLKWSLQIVPLVTNSILATEFLFLCLNRLFSIVSASWKKLFCIVSPPSGSIYCAAQVSMYVLLCLSFRHLQLTCQVVYGLLILVLISFPRLCCRCHTLHYVQPYGSSGFLCFRGLQPGQSYCRPMRCYWLSFHSSWQLLGPSPDLAWVCRVLLWQKSSSSPRITRKSYLHPCIFVLTSEDRTSSVSVALWKSNCVSPICSSYLLYNLWSIIFRNTLKKLLIRLIILLSTAIKVDPSHSFGMCPVF